MIDQENETRDHDGVAGQAVVITGGTTGIGRATAQLLTAHGARVLIFGRSEPDLTEAMDEIRQSGGQVQGLTADVTHPEDVRRVFQEADDWMGGVDILVNCAALPARSVAETDPEDAQYIIQANLSGTISCCKEAIDRMRSKGGGHIVNIGSMAAHIHDQGASLYVATKSGVQGLSKALGKELAEWGIRVSLIEPGNVSSDMVTESPEQQEEMVERQIMLKAEDVAECVYFCLTRPARVNIATIQVRPLMQRI